MNEETISDERSPIGTPPFKQNLITISKKYLQEKNFSQASLFWKRGFWKQVDFYDRILLNWK